MIAQFSYLIGFLLAGLLADYLFEPALRPGGALAGPLGGLFGTGPGAGIALLISLSGLAGAGVALAGYLFPAIRQVETLVPDHEAISTAPIVAASL